ncbi:hypothetical protein ACLOJK_006539 [Asimina triloba]
MFTTSSAVRIVFISHQVLPTLHSARSPPETRPPTGIWPARGAHNHDRGRRRWASRSKQIIEGLEEDSGVGNFRPNGAIGGEEGGDVAIEGFNGLVEGEGIVIGELVMGEVGLSDVAGTTMSLALSFSVFLDYDFREN